MIEKEKCPKVSTTEQGTHKLHCKDNQYFDSQLKQATSYLEKNIASRFMVAVDCQIPVQNVCRYVDKLFKSDDIAVIRKDHCRITGEIVEFLSCNRSLFPKRPVQSKLIFGKENESC